MKLDADPGVSPLPAKSPHELVADWLAYERLHKKRPNTLKRFESAGRLLADGANGFDLTKVTRGQLQPFVEQYTRRCAFFVPGTGFTDQPICKQQCDVTKCPILTGTPVSSCPKYENVSPATVALFISTLEVFYRYLMVVGYVQNNPVTPVRHHFAQANRRALTLQRNRSRKVGFTNAQLLQLFRNTPAEHFAVYYVMAKWGLRPHEAVKLLFDPAHFDLANRILKVPAGGESGDKRIGNPCLPMDLEAVKVFEIWLEHRGKIALKPDEPRLLLTNRGTAWSQKQYQKILTKMLKKDCKRLNLTAPDGGQYTLKSFRYFFTKTLEDNECPPHWVNVLRGDQVPGPARFYWNPESELHRMFDKYGPKFF